MNSYNSNSNNEDQNNEYLTSPMFSDKRSKKKLFKIYNRLKSHIPKEWRTEELSRGILTHQGRFLFQY